MKLYFIKIVKELDYIIFKQRYNSEQFNLHRRSVIIHLTMLSEGKILFIVNIKSNLTSLFTRN